jgi:fumarylpyruvate hydrolase
VFGYGVGIDMTRRDLQAAAKKGGSPWDMAKGFDESCPISKLYRAADIGHPDQGRIALTQNGEVKQDGNLNQQIWSVREIIASLSSFVRLEPGDIILTGTPDGVGPVVKGDQLKVEIEGIASFETRID